MSDSQDSEFEEYSNSEKTHSTLHILTNYFRNFFSEKYREYQTWKRQKLIKEIERHFEKTEELDGEKTQLAQSIRKTVDRYQQIVSLRTEPPPMPKTQKRVLQKQAAFRVESTMMESLAMNIKEAIHNYKPSQQELDIFRMKAITLMRKKGMLPKNISEALKSPIQVQIGEVYADDPKKLTIRFSQCFREFELQGVFIKDVKEKHAHSIPVSESFQLSPLKLTLRKQEKVKEV